MTNYARIGHSVQQVLPEHAEILQDLISNIEPIAVLHRDVKNNAFYQGNLDNTSGIWAAM